MCLQTIHVHTSVLLFPVCLCIGFVCVCMRKTDRKGGGETKLSLNKPHNRKRFVNDTAILGARKQR